MLSDRAVISVSGVIMTGDGYVKRQIDRVREDKNVKAVVLRIESPGWVVGTWYRSSR